MHPSSPVDAEIVDPGEKSLDGKSMRLWPGLLLQSGITNRDKILVNALRYKVQNILVVENSAQIEKKGPKAQKIEAKEKFTKPVKTGQLIRINDHGKEIGEPFQVPLDEVPRKLRLCYAITYDSSQARTLYGKVRLAQTDHSKLTLRRLIVGLGRAPEGSQLEVE